MVQGTGNSLRSQTIFNSCWCVVCWLHFCWNGKSTSIIPWWFWNWWTVQDFQVFFWEISIFFFENMILLQASDAFYYCNFLFACTSLKSIGYSEWRNLARGFFIAWLQVCFSKVATEGTESTDIFMLFAMLCLFTSQPYRLRVTPQHGRKTRNGTFTRRTRGYSPFIPL